MIQVSWRRALVGVFSSALLILGGCSSGRASTKVDEKWLARVPDDQLEGVREAQITQRKANDEVTRADVALRDAERALEVAQRNEDAAKSRRKAREAGLDAAKATGQGAEISRAKAELQGADTGLAAAQAEVAYRKRALTTLESLKNLRGRELAVADAELAQTEYQALKQSGDVRAQQLSGAEFAGAVADARRKAEDAQRDVDANLRQEREARAQWQQLRSQAPAYGGSGLDQK
jgi:hypothetical protein